MLTTVHISAVLPLDRIDYNFFFRKLLITGVAANALTITHPFLLLPLMAEYVSDPANMDYRGG
jgi:hypothetical protein